MGRIRKTIKCIRCGYYGSHAAHNICHNCYSKIDYYKHKIKRQATHKKWVERNRELINKSNRESYWKHHTKNLDRGRRYRQENDEIIKEKAKEKRQTIHYKILNRLRRAKRRNKEKQIIHDFSYDDWIDKLKESGGICQICGEYIGEEKLTMDHTFPISKVPRGFVYSIDDVQPLCVSCNASKRDKIILKILSCK